MSAANSSAKKRRAPPSTEPMKPPPGPVNATMNSPTNTTGMTLPQVISLIDKRLLNLESITKTLADEQQKSTSVSNDATVDVPETMLLEFNARFEIMAEEIAELKNVVMKLQSYTMDVNKMLLEQRMTLGSNNEMPAEDDDEEEEHVEMDEITDLPIDAEPPAPEPEFKQEVVRAVQWSSM